MDYLVFQLYGAMASWGEAAVGGVRPSASYPTRSAVIGLVAAALGIKREQEDKLQALQHSLSIGIKQYTPGFIMRDYHTTQVPSTRKKHRYYTRSDELKENKLNTVLSSRDYRCDALWVVALSLTERADASITLENIASKLRKPTFSLYLGRKSCPLSIPIQPQLLTENTLREALDFSFPALVASAAEPEKALTYEHRCLQKGKYISYYWEGSKQAMGVPENHIVTLSTWDEPVNRARWQFKQRTQYQYTPKEVS